MDLKKISLSAIQSRSVAILGYGNQGRAHALNLRDSGVRVTVGAREGKGKTLAEAEGFAVLSFEQAACAADTILFLLPDQIIPQVYQEVQSLLAGKQVGFAHGFAFHFGYIQKIPTVQYFLVGPKGAGAVLRERYVTGEGLPGVYATDSEDPQLIELAQSYAKAIGLATKVLLKTSFAEETECDLFGEQAVLCGGIFALMEKAFQTLVKNGHSPEMAFFETCFESKLIVDLWMKYGPKEVTERISPTAFYGGLTRGKELVDENAEKKMQSIFERIRSGAFAREWMQEVERGLPTLQEKRRELSESLLEKTYQSMKERIS